MEILGFLSSTIMGLVLGLIGGGGSILTVPILVYLFGLSPVAATGNSLFVVGSTALAGAGAFLKTGNIRLKDSLSFAIPSIIGVLLARKILLPLMPQNIFTLGSFVLTKDILLMVLFAVLMVFASLKMIRGANGNGAAVAADSKPKSLGMTPLIIRGFAVGTVTGFIGAGGGFLIVPALVFLLGLKMQEAVGTSLMIIAANSLVGFASSFQTQESYPWGILLPTTALAIAGLFVGKRLHGFFSEKQLKKGFGWFVLIVGTLILLDQATKF